MNLCSSLMNIRGARIPGINLVFNASKKLLWPLLALLPPQGSNLVTPDLHPRLRESLISSVIILSHGNVTKLGGGDVQTFYRCCHAFVSLQI